MKSVMIGVRSQREARTLLENAKRIAGEGSGAVVDRARKLVNDKKLAMMISRWGEEDG